MTFTVPVIGDAHFASDARQPDRLAAVWQIVKREGPSGTVGCWALPGDFYDGLSDPRTRRAWTLLLQAMAAVAPVVGCYGNHDRDDDLFFFSQLKAAHPIYIFDKPDVVRLVTPQGRGLTIFVLPYPHPAGLVERGASPTDVSTRARDLLDPIFMAAGVELAEARTGGDHTLFIGHANVGGARLSTGQPHIGKEIELDQGLLARLGDCPKILNHIHLPQEIGGAWFTGSITAQNWGEVEDKRYLRVEYAEDQWHVVSVPLHTPKLVHVEATFAMHGVTVSGETHAGEMRLDFDCRPSDVPAESEVRVRVRFKEAERQFYAHGRAAVLEQFAHVKTVKVEPVCETTQGVRAPAVASAVSLVDKLQAFAREMGLEAPADLATAVGQLETLDHDEVLRRFQLAIDGLDETV